MMEVFGSCILRVSLRDVFAESIYPLDSRILLVPLNQDQHCSWLNFLEIAYPRLHYSYFTTRTRCLEFGKHLLELKHPFVRVVSDFAVDAFNELCRMYIKKDVEANIYEAEVTNVKYSANCYGYAFFITLEALEEDVMGVYKTTVLCDFEEGRTTLLKFIRSSRPPVGEKRSNESPELICLKEDYKAVQGACSHTSWKIKSGNPDDWFIPDKMTGLQLRSAEHSCGGYDYLNPLTVFSCFIGLD